MKELLLALLIGGGLGALLGRIGQCSSGACPLTANWKRGAVYGAVMGLLFHFASGGATRSYQEPKNVKPVTEQNFDAEVLQAGQPVVVDFYAKWCGPCKILSPRIDKLAGEFGGKVRFVSVNVDESAALASRFDVQGIPTLLFIGKDGTVQEKSVGLPSEEALRARIEALAKG